MSEKNSQIQIQDLTNKIEKFGLNINCDEILRAYNYSKEAHEGQKRQSGEPYIHHPLSVADILVDFRMDQDSIITAFLHDVVEDTSCSLEDISKKFGSQVAFLVDGITKLSRMNFKTIHQRQSENIRKMIVAMGKDVRVILVKLADRLHNMRTLEYLPEEKRKRIAAETLEIYAPLASRLGMNELKVELEDLSFKYFSPEEHLFLLKKIKEAQKDGDAYIYEVTSALKEELYKNKIQCQVHGRYKNIYSIHRKMIVQNLAFAQVHDLIAFRICVEKLHECYEALGLVHSLWKPVPGKFKDFIAMPKTNNYQSLHTTAIGPKGRQIEVQIRTHEMHLTSERGVAAHWIYKMNNQSIEASLKTLEKVHWLKDLIALHQQSSDSSEFLESVKLDLFESSIYVFTPKGDIKELPKGATIIDFAYTIHTDIGDKLSGAKVNGHQVPLKYKLQNGDSIEVMTSKNQQPKKDWIKMCVTSRALSKIKVFVRAEERKRSLEIGKKIMEKGFHDFKISEKEILSHKKLDQFLKEHGFNKTEDAYIALGFGKIVFRHFVNYFFKDRFDSPETEKKDEKLKSFPGKKSTSPLLVEGSDHVMVHLAKCCYPVSGDIIKGYISHKRGIIVHRVECPSLRQITVDRYIDVAWNQKEMESNQFTLSLHVVCEDSPGVLNQLSEAFTFFGLNISDVKFSVQNDFRVSIYFLTQVREADQINELITRLRKNETVISVVRKSES